MHDFTLDGPVDVGEYTGPVVDGKPLHDGTCEDGVYGCRKCTQRARRLTDEQRASIGWSNEGTCDWCHKTVAASEMSGVQPWDEGGSTYYEICASCRSNYYKELERELAEEKEYGAYEHEEDFYPMDDEDAD